MYFKGDITKSGHITLYPGSLSKTIWRTTVGPESDNRQFPRGKSVSDHRSNYQKNASEESFKRLNCTLIMVKSQLTR